MIKKFFFLSLLFWYNVITPCHSQTIVSTEPENKRAVLEYFRGIYCVYCPEADQFAKQLQNQFNSQFIPINIHAGDYAYPMDPFALDLRSSYGQPLLELTHLIGYPVGMVNRRNFRGLEQGASGTLGINRERWEQAVEQVVEELSPVNIGVQANFDLYSREMTILVELYYTQAVNATSQALHIAVIQDSIRTLQAGSPKAFNYFHSNVLRDMVTGQWGMLVGPKQAGDFFSHTFTYYVPEEIRGASIDPSDLRLVAFVTEDHEHILSGIRHQPLYTTNRQKDLHILTAYPQDQLSCKEEITPVVVIRNDGHDLVENARFSYRVNAGPLHYFDWPGQLKTFEKARLQLPSIWYAPAANLQNQLEVWLLPTDDNVNNNQALIPFKSSPSFESNAITLELRTDNFGFETYWEILNDANEIIEQGGNLLVGLSAGGKQVATTNNPGIYANHETITARFELPGPGCYRLRIYDDYGDGFCCNFGEGFYRLRDEQGQILLSGNRFGVLREETFELPELTAVTPIEVVDFSTFNVYPNPVYGQLLQLSFGLEKASPVSAQLKTATGQLVFEHLWDNLTPQDQTVSLSLPDLPFGVYFLTLQVGRNFSTQKVLVVR